MNSPPFLGTFSSNISACVHTYIRSKRRNGKKHVALSETIVYLIESRSVLGCDPNNPCSLIYMGATVPYKTVLTRHRQLQRQPVPVTSWINMHTTTEWLLKIYHPCYHCMIWWQLRVILSWRVNIVWPFSNWSLEQKFDLFNKSPN